MGEKQIWVLAMNIPTGAHLAGEINASELISSFYCPWRKLRVIRKKFNGEKN